MIYDMRVRMRVYRDEQGPPVKKLRTGLETSPVPQYSKKTMVEEGTTNKGRWVQFRTTTTNKVWGVQFRTTMVARRKIDRKEQGAVDGEADPDLGTARHHQDPHPQDPQAPPPCASSSPYRGVGSPQDPGLVQTKLEDYLIRKRKKEPEEVHDEEEEREEDGDKRRGGRGVRKKNDPVQQSENQEAAQGRRF